MFRVGDKVVLHTHFLNKDAHRDMDTKRVWQNNSTLLDVIEVNDGERGCAITVSDGHDMIGCLPQELIFAFKEDIEASKNKKSSDFDFDKNFYVLELEEPIDGSIFIASYIDSDGYIYGIYPETRSGLICISKDEIKRITSAISKY